MILRYFSSRPRAGRPCQGSSPRRKYHITYPIASISSLRLYSIPRCVFILAYLAVPVKLFLSEYGICSWVLRVRKALANPKSIRCIRFARVPLPSKKLSGFMSRCRNPLLCINSILHNIWSAIISIVFIENRRLQNWKSSSSDGPSKAITIILCSRSYPDQ